MLAWEQIASVFIQILSPRIRSLLPLMLHHFPTYREKLAPRFEERFSNFFPGRNFYETQLRNNAIGWNYSLNIRQAKNARTLVIRETKIALYPSLVSKQDR